MTNATLVFLIGALAEKRAVEALGARNPRATHAYGLRLVAGDGTPYEAVTSGDDKLTGLLVELDNATATRFRWMADWLGYDVRSVRTEAGEALAMRSVKVPGAEREWNNLGAEALSELLAYYPDVSGARMRALAKIVIGRVASHKSALRQKAPNSLRKGQNRSSVEVHKLEKRHRGFFHMEDVTLSHPRFDGGQQTVRRETFIGTDATLVLPYDPVADQVVLIEQFRVGPYRRGDQIPWMLEPVAGLIDPGETAETTAIREAEEEANVSIGQLVPMPGGYPSPGATAEYFHMFVGLCDLSDYAPGQAGLPDEGEDILSHLLSLDDAIALLETKEAPVVPLALMLVWTAWKREELRSIELRRRGA